MKFWIDTEFDDSGGKLDLISLAAVSEDDREFYAISSDFEPGKVKPWVKDNVLPHLEARDSDCWRPLHEIGQAFLAYVGEEPAEFWSYNPTYDWYLITWHCFAGWDNLPSNWPFECWDLGQWAWHLGSPTLPVQQQGAHHALADAHFHRQIYEFLAQYEKQYKK